MSLPEEEKPSDQVAWAADSRHSCLNRRKGGPLIANATVSGTGVATRKIW